MLPASQLIQEKSTYLCQAEPISGELGGETSSVYAGRPYEFSWKRVMIGAGEG